MKKIVLYFGVVVFAVLVVLQFFGEERPEVRQENPDDIMLQYSFSNELKALVKSACYDCHSYETKYPWYAGIAPVSSFLYHHIEEGRDELNFSEWKNYSKTRQIRKIKEVAEEIEESKMPLESYVWLHAEADLTSEQKERIISWANELARVLSEEN